VNTGGPTSGIDRARDNHSVVRDIWAAGDLYEPYVGRWSRLVATAFVEWLAAQDGGRWLDVGSGTGALASAIAAGAHPALVVGIDPSLPFIRHARSGLPDYRVVFAVGDGLALPAGGGAFERVVSGLVLNFFADPLVAVREMCRAAAPGGTVAAYVWDYAGRMQLMRYFWDAVVALDPAAEELDEARRFALCQPERLQALFEASGLSAVATSAIEVPTTFADFDDYWVPFLGGQGPAPGYVAALTEDRRTMLRERLRADLPASSDGSIALVARAWTVRGTA